MQKEQLRTAQIGKLRELEQLKNKHIQEMEEKIKTWEKKTLTSEEIISEYQRYIEKLQQENQYLIEILELEYKSKSLSE